MLGFVSVSVFGEMHTEKLDDVIHEGCLSRMWYCVYKKNKLKQ